MEPITITFQFGVNEQEQAALTELREKYLTSFPEGVPAGARERWINRAFPANFVDRLLHEIALQIIIAAGSSAPAPATPVVEPVAPPVEEHEHAADEPDHEVIDHDPSLGTPAPESDLGVAVEGAEGGQ